MKKLRSIIIDDEKDSRQILQNYIGKYCPNVIVVGEAANIKDGQDAIEAESPDLIFLDIEMPFGNAFDLLENINAIDFEIIFVTAFSEYAIQAFNRSAVHYILKPVDIDELILAVSKAKDRLQEKASFDHTRLLLDNISSGNKQQQKIALPLLDGFEVVKLEDIIYCEANDNFTEFHFVNGNKSMICRKLKFYEENLKSLGFCRVHRSFIINLDFVKRYIKGKGGTIIMSNDKEIQLANARKQLFLDMFR